MVKVKDYINYLNEKKSVQLFDEECYRRIDNVKKVYGDIESEEVILEVLLDKQVRTCDYSIKVLTKDNPLISEYWYELDYDAIETENINSCYFIDAAPLKPHVDCSEYYNGPLTKLAGEQRVKKLTPMLQHCIDLLDGKCKEAYQVGAMSGRGQDNQLRLFPSGMKKDKVLQYLKELNWTGNFVKLEDLLNKFEPYSQGKVFIVDFDISENGISQKIGINFSPSPLQKDSYKEFLKYLNENKMCLTAKMNDIFAWIDRYPAHTPFMQNDISHFKFAFDGEKLIKSKCYLRQGSRVMNTRYVAYDTPLLMNLELTTRCPLHCPQCYVELNTGKDLDVDTALYFIDEGAKNHIRTVNLSGGETLAYPPLTQLIKRCASHGMQANIAVSGWNCTKEKLQEFIDAGVYYICVSLNGSSEPVNRLTRDGYELAVNTLKLLQELKFPRTTINWVMHRNNCDDFPQLVKLAESYDVSDIAVMVFKPDSSHQLPTVPTGEQMRQIASFIKSYKGPIKIEAEECYSQMRALVGEKFLFNQNVGVARGCGAGRDGISITVDGRITPCRHLLFEEDNLSIRDYWDNSPVLKELRSVEQHMEEPCSGCKFKHNCLPCNAVNVKLHDHIAMGNKECPLNESLVETQEDELILVNYKDETIGFGKKQEVHEKGLLHRAFSVFIFKDNQLLIQKRADHKYHCGGLYANTCCSHPRKGEKLQEAVVRRLQQEAGITCNTYEIDSFIYRAPFENGLTEYEYDHVFVGEYDGEYKCNPQEASEMKYVDIDWLLVDITKNPKAYAPWFITALPIALKGRK